MKECNLKTKQTKIQKMREGCTIKERKIKNRLLKKEIE